MTSVGHYNARVGTTSSHGEDDRPHIEEQRVDALTAIKRLYYNATRTTIQRDVTRAIDLLKGMKSDDERQDAAVYMDGLSQMRSEWAAARPPKSGPPKSRPAKSRPAGSKKPGT